MCSVEFVLSSGAQFNSACVCDTIMNTALFHAARPGDIGGRRDAGVM